MSGSGYLTAEARARVKMDRQLVACGWVVQDRKEMNLYAAQGVAVREFIMATDHGRADYLLFVDEQAVGAIEAKPAGASLSGVEPQSAKYAKGLPANLSAPCRPLPFLYESNGEETMFTDGFDPLPRSRPTMAFLRPDTLARHVRLWSAEHDAGSLRSRLERLRPLVEIPGARDQGGLRTIQLRAINAIEGSMLQNRSRSSTPVKQGSERSASSSSACETPSSAPPLAAVSSRKTRATLRLANISRTLERCQRTTTNAREVGSPLGSVTFSTHLSPTDVRYSLAKEASRCCG